MEVCGAGSMSCCYEAEDELTLREFKQGIETAVENVRGVTTCNCLPACTSIAYEAEISQTDYEYNAAVNGRNINPSPTVVDNAE